MRPLGYACQRSAHGTIDSIASQAAAFFPEDWDLVMCACDTPTACQAVVASCSRLVFRFRGVLFFTQAGNFAYAVRPEAHLPARLRAFSAADYRAAATPVNVKCVLSVVGCPPSAVIWASGAVGSGTNHSCFNGSSFFLSGALNSTSASCPGFISASIVSIG